MNVSWPLGAATAASAFLTCTAAAQEAVPAGAQESAPAVAVAGAAAAAEPAVTVNFAEPVAPEPDAPEPDAPELDAPELDAAGPGTATDAGVLPSPVRTVAVAQYDDRWRFTVTPYVFLPAIDGELSFNPPPGNDGAPNVSIDAEDILEALEFAFMISADAHYDRFGVVTDVLFVDLGSQKAQVDRIIRPGGVVDVPIDVDTSVDFNAWLWTGAVGYELGEPGGMSFEPLLGFRLLSAEVDLNWSFTGPLGLFPQTGALSQEEDIWDGIAGVRGRIPFGEDSRWSLTYYGDVGAGDSELTWQVIGSIGYAYGWGDLRLAWRHIAYDQGDDAFLQDFSLSGPAFGATFRF